MKAQELHYKLAERVRGDSKYLTELTSASGLAPVQAGSAPDALQADLMDIARDDETFKDIKTITGPTGQVYFYSEMHMTETYARILARVKAGDPCITIAETVREESRVYPRPTSVELFRYGLFKIDRDQVEQHVTRTLERYDDIKSFTTSHGGMYLYSTQYLTAEWAKYLAKKHEKGDS